MDTIGKLAATLTGSTPLRSPSGASAPASTANPPRLVDQLCDVDLPKLLTGYRPDSGPWEAARALTPAERNALTDRAGELQDCLAGYRPEEREEVEGEILAMLGGFRSVRERGENVEAMAMVAASVLRGLPLWAIKRGCMLIARREVVTDPPLHPSFAPSDGQICDVVKGVVAYHRKRLEMAERVLTARPRPPQAPQMSREEMEAKLGRPIGAREERIPADPPARNDGKHLERVAADLKRRRAASAAGEAA